MRIIAMSSQFLLILISQFSDRVHYSHTLRLRPQIFIMKSKNKYFLAIVCRDIINNEIDESVIFSTY